MADRKLYQVLRGLEEAEVIKLETSLRNDTRAASKRMWKFYAALKKNVLSLDLDVGQIRDAEDKLALQFEKGNRDINQAFRRRISKLYTRLQTFLVQQEIEALPEGLRYLLLLRAFERRALQGPFFSVYGEFERKSEDMPAGDLLYELKFRAAQLAIEIQNPGESLNKDSFRDIGDLLAGVDHNYLFHLARLNAYIVNFNKTTDSKLPPHHPRIMWELAAAIDRKEHPAIDIYLTFLEFIAKPLSGNSIQGFFKKYQEVYERLEPIEQYLMFGYCLNQAQSLANRGVGGMDQLVLDLYMMGIEERLLFSGGKMDWKMLKSMVQFALKVKEVDLARKYINELSEDLIWYDYEGQKEGLRHLMEGKILLVNGEYEKALSELNIISLHYKLNDVMQELDLRTMKAQLYYLLEQWEQGLHTLDALRMYAKNNRELLNNNADRVMRWRQRWFKRLYRLGPRDKRKGIPKLIAELEKDPEFRLKPWFMEELRKL